MKKFLVWSGIGVVVLVVLAVVAVSLFLDKAVKKGIETVGPQIAKVSVKLDDVSLSLWSGSGSIRGLVVGNPEGYKTPSAIEIGSAGLALKPSSLFSDKVVIRSINVQAPVITFEGTLKGSNLSRIQENIRAATGGDAARKPAADDSAASKKLQVDEFVVAGGRINFSTPLPGGRSLTVPLPDIRLTGLGTGPEGITAGDLTARALDAILGKSLEAAVEALGKLGKEALEGAASDGLKKAAQGVTDIFKKKK